MSRSNRLPKILCLHGSGTNLDIFQIQTRKLRNHLKNSFRFIFVNAPFSSPPGPGVLPFFNADDDFYAWIPHRRRSRKPHSRGIDLMKEREADEGLKRALLDINELEVPFVGVMGFSQGAGMAASLLLRAQQSRNRGENCYWGSLQFGIMFNGTADYDVIRIPTVQVHGLLDPWLKNGRSMLDCFFARETVDLIEFNVGHHLTPEEDGARRVADVIRKMDACNFEKKGGSKEMSLVVTEIFA
ncbi:hypothetical protein DL98DRAFT_552208 [Cadophora sp. DSE1049]|nr:hypothetical protein DL98DRAFT_552208 [Cadophora sp. DSE1049]